MAAAGELPAPAILKLDIQGAEMMALRGAENLLKRGEVLLILKTWFVPVYDGAALFCELSAFLEQYGYTLFNLYNFSTAANGQARYADAIFVSERLRQQIIDPGPPEP